MNADVTTFLVGSSSSYCKITLFVFTVCCTSVGVGCHGIGGLKFLIGVVDEIFFVRHGDGVGWGLDVGSSGTDGKAVAGSRIVAVLDVGKILSRLMWFVRCTDAR